MIDYQNLYLLIMDQNWEKIISIIHKEKPKKEDDLLIAEALKAFETEILRYASESLDFSIHEDLLEQLYLMQFGRIYQLEADNFERLIHEIIRRKTDEDAYDYAQELPHSPICKDLIVRVDYKRMIKLENEKMVLGNLERDWHKIYNRWFKLVSVYGNSLTYISKKKFFNELTIVFPHHPSLEKVEAIRDDEDREMERSILFFDMMDKLTIRERLIFMLKLLNRLKRFEPVGVNEIYDMLGINNI